ncbi:MAG: hypothetical protein JST44_12195 [Cyanobacteria bacterium SZAS LIN-5]|nr:hypothetical protein [Cyanobacteria bacterium SZAS LIN-5]
MIETREDTNAKASATTYSDGETAQLQKNTNLDGWKFNALGLSICFITGLVLCLRTNFSHAALDVAPMFDSGKYISSTQMVMNATTFIHHFTLQEWQTICSALKEPLMMDGPVLPLLGAAWFSLIHKSPDLFDMRAALALQALLHAASACCMYLAARRLLRNNRWALFAGLLWAAFPSAVLGAGRFMTENITSTLLLSAACLVPSRLSDRYLRSFALGCIAATVVLLKAALLPGLLAGFIVVAFVLWRDSEADAAWTCKRLLVHAISAAIGLMLVLAPWLLFTKEATGSYSVTAQREPVLNIVIGGNSENDGWSGNPETGFVKLFDTVNGDKGGTFLGIWQANFSRLSNIAIRRVARLWSCPWNDCLSKFLGMPLPAQWIWHQIILSLAAFGALLIMFKKSPNESKTHGKTEDQSTDKLVRPVIYLSATLLVSHLIYMIFNASPRQAFTSMPFIVLLASYALYQTVKSTKQRKVVGGYLLLAVSIWIALCTIDFHSIMQSCQLEQFTELVIWLLFVCAAAAMSTAVVAVTGNKKAFPLSLCLQIIPAAIICSAFATTARNVPEWQCQLKGNTIANRSVQLTSPDKADWAMLVIDGDTSITHAVIEVNKTKLGETLAPLSTFTSDKNLMVNYSVFGGVSNKNPEQMRQWRGVVVPLSLLKNGENSISISSPDGHATIYGSFIRTEDGKLVAPTLNGFSGCKLLSETQPKLDARYSEPLTASAAKGKCWLTKDSKDSFNDLSPDFGNQAGQYRLFLCLGANPSKGGGSTAKVLQDSVLESSPIIISAQNPFVKRYAVPQGLGQSTFINVTVSGTFAEEAVSVLSKVDVRNMTNLGSDLNLPNSIKAITGKEFKLSGSLSRESLNQPNEFFEIKLESKQPVHLDNLSLKLAADERPDFAKSKVAIY